MIEIYVNERKYTLTNTQTLQEFLTQLTSLEEHFAIAINQKLVPKSNYAAIILNANDHLEIIVPQQGG